MYILIFALLGSLSVVCNGRQVTHRRRKPLQHRRKFLITNDRFTIDNMTCSYFEQPLNHFAPWGSTPFYMERYCIYDGFETGTDKETSPILFYAGNEAPVEEYINNTGLMWQLAPKFHAKVVFAEHRYEGNSLPPLNLTEKCMSYSSSQQAIADFVRLLDYINPRSTRPVVAFGGSYGGMLASWLRIKYPNMIAGAIAASAPIWGFPRNRPTEIDTASRVVQRGLELPYPPTNTSDTRENHCSSNLLAAWPLIYSLGQTNVGRDYLMDVFHLCHPLSDEADVDMLIGWGQTPWFDLAEGSFPYPSTYIPFGLGMGVNYLPSWPTQSACWVNSTLHQDLNVRFEPKPNMTRSDVNYIVHYGDDELVLDVDWDNVTVVTSTHPKTPWNASNAVNALLSSVNDAVSVWYNVTMDLKCFDLTPAPNSKDQLAVDATIGRHAFSQPQRMRRSLHDDQASCEKKLRTDGSWPSICCNEDMNMVTTYASGMGHDMHWPPSFPRGTRSYQDIVDQDTSDIYDFCQDPTGEYGYPSRSDPWSTWLDLYYGTRRLGSHSNIVFSNGLLDPWSSAGVYAKGMDPTPRSQEVQRQRYDGPMVQNITEDGSIIGLIIEFGGHHTDLMYSDDADPDCVTHARRIEESHISRWVSEWQESACNSQPFLSTVSIVNERKGRGRNSTN